VLQLQASIPRDTLGTMQISQGCYVTDWISSKHRIIYKSCNKALKKTLSSLACPVFLIQLASLPLLCLNQSV